MISNEQAMAIREIAKTLGTLKTLEQICDRMKCRVSDLFDEEN
jgi:DNA-binding Xre family transcriptional regulator